MDEETKRIMCEKRYDAITAIISYIGFIDSNTECKITFLREQAHEIADVAVNAYIDYNK